MHSQSLFTRDFWLISCVNLIVMTAYYSLMVTTAQFASSTFHASTSVAALSAGITVLGILVSRFSSGYLTQHFSTKSLIVVGAIILIPATFLYQLAASVPTFMLVRFLHGLAIGLISTVTNTAVVLLFPEERQGEGIGYFSLSTTLATAIGPFLGLLLMQLFGFNALFTIESGLSVVVLLLVLGINANKIRFKAADGPQTASIKNFIEPQVLDIALIMFIVALSYASLQTYMSFYTTALHISAYSSFFFLVYAIAILISRPITGRLLDRLPAKRVILPSLLINALGLVLLSTIHSGLTLLLAAFLIGIGFGNFQSAAQTVVAKRVPLHRLSQATATFFIFFDLSIGVGPTLLGQIVPIVGYRMIFIMTAGFCLIGLIGYLFSDHHQATKPATTPDELTAPQPDDLD